MNKISIIIPIYNVEPYLQACLNSVLKQTHSDWEAILVDDGSTDKSGVIADEYSELDSRFKVIHQSNKGLSEARNTGLKKATGEYIGFVDSDDIINPTLYSTLLEQITQYKVSVSAISHKGFKNDEEIIFERTNNRNTIVLKQCEAIEKMYNYSLSGCVWNKLYKRNLLENLSFYKGSGEDWDFNLKVFLRCKKISVSNAILYYYRLREDGLTKGYSLKWMVDDLITHCDIYDNYKARSNKDSMYNGIILHRLYRNILNRIHEAYYTDLREYTLNVCKDVYNRTHIDFFNCKDIPIIEKISFGILYRMPWIYSVMLKCKKSL